MTEEELLRKYEILIEAINELHKEAEEIKTLHKEFNEKIEIAQARIDDDIAQGRSISEYIEAKADTVNELDEDIKSLKTRVDVLEKKIGGNPPPPPPPPPGIKEYFESQGFEVIDKRPSGGALWVVGDREELEPHVKYVREEYGVIGNYGSGRATRQRYAWYTQSDK